MKIYMLKFEKNSEREPKNYLEIKILHFTSIIRLCVVKIPQSLHLHATINSAIARQRYTWVVYIWKHWLEYSSPYTFHKSITACLRYDCQLLPLRKLQLNGVREKSCRSDRLRCNSVKRKVKKSIHSVRPSIFSSNDFFLSLSLISEDLIAKLTDFIEREKDRKVKGLIMRSSLCNYNF